MTELDFSFMVFQSNPQKEIVYYYPNGEKARRMMRREEFYELVSTKSPQLVGPAHQALITYSFYLWSLPDQTITHLTPQADDAPYPDSRFNLLHQKKIPILGEKKSIEATLLGYGFSVPTKGNIENLRVSMEKRDTQAEGFFSRFMNRGRH